MPHPVDANDPPCRITEDVKALRALTGLAMMDAVRAVKLAISDPDLRGDPVLAAAYL